MRHAEIIKYWITGVCILFLLFSASFGLMYPLASWAMRRTTFLPDAIVNTYGLVSTILGFSLGLLLDFVYRRFFLKRSGKETSN